MNMTLQTNVKTTPTSTSFTAQVKNGLIQRKCSRCGTFNQDDERKYELKKGLCLQCRSTRSTTLSAIPPVVHEVPDYSGQLLDPEIYTFMEPRFGHDFSKERVLKVAHAIESAVGPEEAVSSSDVDDDPIHRSLIEKFRKGIHNGQNVTFVNVKKV